VVRHAHVVGQRLEPVVSHRSGQSSQWSVIAVVSYYRVAKGA
ncbi:MAG: hypothetical protein ACI89G_001794, partial [Minisyncoccia bacterium]